MKSENLEKLREQFEEIECSECASNCAIFKEKTTGKYFCPYHAMEKIKEERQLTREDILEIQGDEKRQMEKEYS